MELAQRCRAVEGHGGADLAGEAGSAGHGSVAAAAPDAVEPDDGEADYKLRLRSDAGHRDVRLCWTRTGERSQQRPGDAGARYGGAGTVSLSGLPWRGWRESPLRRDEYGRPASGLRPV